MSMFVLAHLSDPHIAPLPTPRLAELASKRLLGFLNWYARRRAIHRRETLERIVADVKAQAPDHIAVTGDLANISLRAEFSAARTWLAGLGPPQRVTVVPGNHDAYVRAMLHESAAQWADFMRGDGRTQTQFPSLRRRAGVALVGLSSAIASAPWMSTGRLGGTQIARLIDTLTELGAERQFRVVLIHHPPESEPRRWRERLVDARALRRALARAGAELVLHGHEHRNSIAWFDGPERRIAAIGVPSASAAAGGAWAPAGYNLYRIERAGADWRCEMVTRGLQSDGGVVELGRRMIRNQ